MRVSAVARSNWGAEPLPARVGAPRARVRVCSASARAALSGIKATVADGGRPCGQDLATAHLCPWLLARVGEERRALCAGWVSAAIDGAEPREDPGRNQAYV